MVKSFDMKDVEKVSIPIKYRNCSFRIVGYPDEF